VYMYVCMYVYISACDQILVLVFLWGGSDQ